MNFLKWHIAIILCFCFWAGTASVHAAGDRGRLIVDFGLPFGDVNADLVTDVADVNILINVLLGNDDAEKYGSHIFITDDDLIDVSDVNQIINILLGRVSSNDKGSNINKTGYRYLPYDSIDFSEQADTLWREGSQILLTFDGDEQQRFVITFSGSEWSIDALDGASVEILKPSGTATALFADSFTIAQEGIAVSGNVLTSSNVTYLIRDVGKYQIMTLHATLRPMMSRVTISGVTSPFVIKNLYVCDSVLTTAQFHLKEQKTDLSFEFHDGVDPNGSAYCLFPSNGGSRVLPLTLEYHDLDGKPTQTYLRNLLDMNLRVGESTVISGPHGDEWMQWIHDIHFCTSRGQTWGTGVARADIYDSLGQTVTLTPYDGARCLDDGVFQSVATSDVTVARAEITADGRLAIECVGKGTAEVSFAFLTAQGELLKRTATVHVK